MLCCKLYHFINLTVFVWGGGGLYHISFNSRNKLGSTLKEDSAIVIFNHFLLDYTNTLAFYVIGLIMGIKSFIIQTLGVVKRSNLQIRVSKFTQIKVL